MPLCLRHAVPLCPISGHMLGCRKRLGRRGATSWPSPAWPGGQRGRVNATAAVLQPHHPLGPRHHLYLLPSPERQQAVGQADSSCCCGATMPGPRGLQPWTGQGPWRSGGCHGNHRGGHCRHPPWGQQGSQLGLEGRGFI